MSTVDDKQGAGMGEVRLGPIEWGVVTAHHL